VNANAPHPNPLPEYRERGQRRFKRWDHMVVRRSPSRAPEPLEPRTLFAAAAAPAASPAMDAQPSVHVLIDYSLDDNHFFGEGCLVGQPNRMATASAMARCTIVVVEKPDMVRQLHARPAFADRFLTHMLTRNIRIEEDLIDQLFNSSEKRLARTLLLLARYGEPEASHRTLPRVSQETLAEMVGTTRSRVNYFMNKFRKLGFIDYNGGLKINNSLLSVVLRD